ncbi:hypothetical protein Hanom_Chr09g00864961 [Helianthus anomalus]
MKKSVKKTGFSFFSVSFLKQVFLYTSTPAPSRRWRPLPDVGDEPPPLPCSLSPACFNLIGWFNFGGPLLGSNGFPYTPLGSP